MNCQNCIFGKVIDDKTVECHNPYSDDFEEKISINHCGCKDGRLSTVGIDATQSRFLKMM